MNDYLLPAIELGPKDANASVIWLHGLGADGHDFEPIVSELNLSHQKNIRFIFPHAPQRPVTINNGTVMRAWYDIAANEIDAKQDETGIRESAKQIQALISREHERGVPSERIVLAGFSQGGAIALHTGLRYAHRLAGILALSTYLPLADSLSREAHTDNQDVPIFMAHGTQDPVVPFKLGEQSRDTLQAQGYKIEWRQYVMEHNVLPDEIEDIAAWFNSVIN